MDPNETLQKILDGFENMNHGTGANIEARAETLEALRSMVEWITHGGFAPELPDQVAHVIEPQEDFHADG